MDENVAMGGHCYRVAVLCEGGENGETSNESCATAGPCYPPRNLDFEYTNNYKAKLMWEAPQPNDGLSGYYLFRKDGDSEYRRIKLLNASAVSFTDNGLNQEGDYYYRLYAYYGNLDCTSAPANRRYYPNGAWSDARNIRARNGTKVGTRKECRRTDACDIRARNETKVGT